MKFKILLVCSNRIPAPRWGAIKIPRKKRLVMRMMVLWYFNWTGTMEERADFEKTAKGRWNEVDGVKVKGIYTPLTEWNRVFVFEVESFDKWAAAASPPDNTKVPFSKVELFF